MLGPGWVRRPAGMRFDSGGFGKGLAADAAATLLAGHRRFVVDCGGDMFVAGRREVHVAHPDGGVAHRLVAEGGIATSGIGRRAWSTARGPAHHLLDPATGAPAWTGVVQATALAPSALEAETLAKTALLSGPLAGRRVLRLHGGVLIGDDGGVEVVSPPGTTLEEAA